MDPLPCLVLFIFFFLYFSVFLCQCIVKPCRPRCSVYLLPARHSIPVSGVSSGPQIVLRLPLFHSSHLFRFHLCSLPYATLFFHPLIFISFLVAHRSTWFCFYLYFNTGCRHHGHLYQGAQRYVTFTATTATSTLHLPLLSTVPWVPTSRVRVLCPHLDSTEQLLRELQRPRASGIIGPLPLPLFLPPLAPKTAPHYFLLLISPLRLHCRLPCHFSSSHLITASTLQRFLNPLPIPP